MNEFLNVKKNKHSFLKKKLGKRDNISLPLPNLAISNHKIKREEPTSLKRLYREPSHANVKFFLFQGYSYIRELPPF